MPTDSNRHWDTVCLGTVTIATAVLGVVVLVAGGSDITVAASPSQYTIPGVSKALLAAAAIVVYLGLVGTAGLAIYRVNGRRAARRGLKRRIANLVYWLFAAEIIALALMLAVDPAFGLVKSAHSPKPDKEQSVELSERKPTILVRRELIRDSMTIPVGFGKFFGDAV